MQSVSFSRPTVPQSYPANNTARRSASFASSVHPSKPHGSASAPRFGMVITSCTCCTVGIVAAGLVALYGVWKIISGIVGGIWNWLFKSDKKDSNNNGNVR